MAQQYLFLSDEWIEAARLIRERHRDAFVDAPVATVINVNVTDIPHRDDLAGHIDTRSGRPAIEIGHVAEPELTVTLDYSTARAVFVEPDPQALMAAFFGGKIFVEGDASRLLALQGPPPQPDDPMLEVYAEIAAITAPD